MQSFILFETAEKNKNFIDIASSVIEQDSHLRNSSGFNGDWHICRDDLTLVLEDKLAVSF
jgi:hypothetical protein